MKGFILVAFAIIVGTLLVIFKHEKQEIQNIRFSRSLLGSTHRQTIYHPSVVHPNVKDMFRLSTSSHSFDPKSVQTRDGALNVNTCNPEVIHKLTVAISSDPEHSSLRPLSFSMSGEENSVHHFSGLYGALPFLNNRIAFVGDSTLRGLVPQLGWLLEKSLNHDDDPVSPAMDTMTLSEADKLIIHVYRRVVERTIHLKGGHILKYLLAGSERTLEGRDMLNLIIDFKPKVLVANIGMHLLHMENFGRDMDVNVGIRKWLAYEEFLQDTVIASEEAGVELLLFKTTNFICGAKYKQSWKKGYELYGMNDSATLDKCFLSYRRQHDNDVLDEDIRSYCRDGVINDNGSQKLNERLYGFVNEVNHKRKQEGGPSPLTIAVFNDHDIQSCGTTRKSDGRHHPALNLARIRLLGNYIGCMLNSNWGDSSPNIG